MKNVQWELMLPDELEQAFQETPLVYFTYGLCEPHGPQNALGLRRREAVQPRQSLQQLRPMLRPTRWRQPHQPIVQAHEFVDIQPHSLPGIQ